MRENVWNGIADWPIKRQSNDTRYPALAWTITKEEELESTGELSHKFARILSEKACTWKELVDQTSCGQSTNWLDPSQMDINVVCGHVRALRRVRGKEKAEGRRTP